MFRNDGFVFTMARKFFWSSAAAAAAALLLGGNPARAQDETPVSSTRVPAITLPGGHKITSFDISFVDPVIGVYLLADRTNKAVQAVDTYTNTLFGPYTATPPFAGVAHNPNGTVNNDKSGPDGVLTVNHREIWAGDGDSTIKVIDLFTGKTTHVINTGGKNRADELCFDPRNQLVMMANDAEDPFPFVTIISTRSYSVLTKITMDGVSKPAGGLVAPKATNGIEQCQWDLRTGNFYVNIPEVNGTGNDKAPGAVLEISPNGKILSDWVVPLAFCAGPQGMALGPDNQILLGCNDPNKTVKSTIIVHNSKGIADPIIVVPNQDGSDEVWYNEGTGEYFLALSGGANPQRLGIIDLTLDPDITDQSVKTGLPNTAATPHGTNHSVAVDPVFNQIYVPIASTSGSKICGTSGGLDSQGCIAVFIEQGPLDPPLPAE